MAEQGTHKPRVAGSSPAAATTAPAQPKRVRLGRLAQLARASGSHPEGRRFKSSIAHQGSRRSGGMADALRSGRSARKGVGVQISPSAPPSFFKGARAGGSPPRPHLRRSYRALVAQWIRALPCGGRGRGFESRRARHLLDSRRPDSHRPDRDGSQAPSSGFTGLFFAGGGQGPPIASGNPAWLRGRTADPCAKAPAPRINGVS